MFQFELSAFRAREVCFLFDSFILHKHMFLLLTFPSSDYPQSMHLGQANIPLDVAARAKVTIHVCVTKQEYHDDGTHIYPHWGIWS